jgi:hypothetical protein
MKLLDNYNRWVDTNNWLDGNTDKYGTWYPKQYRWNIFDSRNLWMPSWWEDYLHGWACVRYSFEEWCEHMSGYKRPFGAPVNFWAEINDGSICMKYDADHKQSLSMTPLTF